MKIQDEPAYILHQRPYRDTSQLIELFSKHHGRLTVVSRGSRSPKSKLKAILQPFRPVIVSWSGKTELSTLTAAEASADRAPVISASALSSAFYVNELLMRLLHRFDVHVEIFDLYESLLYQLNSHTNLETSLRIFEKELLQHLGFALNLSTDADSGEPLSIDERYVYYVEHGPVVTSKNHDDSAKLVLQGKSLLDYDRGDLSSVETRKQIKSLMRYVLNYYLEGKPLKSRELFR